MNKVLLSVALAGVVAASATVVQAADAPAKVKCYGIAKAGKNDCKSADGKNACQGHSTRDNDMNDWKFAADAASCEKEGGKLEAPKK